MCNHASLLKMLPVDTWECKVTRYLSKSQLFKKNICTNEVGELSTRPSPNPSFCGDEREALVPTNLPQLNVSPLEGLYYFLISFLISYACLSISYLTLPLLIVFHHVFFKYQLLGIWILLLFLIGNLLEKWFSVIQGTVQTLLDLGLLGCEWIFKYKIRKKIKSDFIFIKLLRTFDNIVFYFSTISNPSCPGKWNSSTMNFFTNVQTRIMKYDRSKPVYNTALNKFLHIRRIKSLSPLHNHYSSFAPGCVTAPIVVKNNAPWIVVKIGDVSIELLCDSGSPRNFISKKLWQTFEEKHHYRCTRFENKDNIKAHNDSVIETLPFGVLLPLLIMDVYGKQHSVLLPFLIEHSEIAPAILGLGSMQNLCINMLPFNSRVTLNIKSNMDYITESWNVPLAVEAINLDKGTLHAQVHNISTLSGNYWFQPLTKEDHHNPECYSIHDVRKSCTDYNHHCNDCDDAFLNPCQAVVNSTLNSQVVSVRNGRFKLNNVTASDSNITGYIGCLTPIIQSPLQADSAIGERPNFNNTSVPHNECKPGSDIIQATDYESDETKSSASYEISIIPDEIARNILQGLCEEQPRELGKGINSDIPLVSLTTKQPVDTEKALYFYVANLQCKSLFSEDSETLAGILPRKSRILKKMDMNLPSVHLVKRKYVLIRTSLNNINVSILQTLRLLPSIIALNVKYLIFQPLSSTEHEFLNNFAKLMANAWNICSFDGQGTIMIYIQDKITHVYRTIIADSGTIIKNAEYLADSQTLPEATIEQPEAFPAHCENSYEQDLERMYANSDPTEHDFIKELLDKNPNVASKSATDIGRIWRREFHLDLELTSPECQLPMDTPYPVNANLRAASGIINKIWEDSGLTCESDIRTHASRIIVVRKHLNPSDFLSIRKRLERDHAIQIDPDNQNELLQVDPHLLTTLEVTKLYRCCLDARSVNKITRDEVTLSPNPEMSLIDLCAISGTLDLPMKSNIQDNELPETKMINERIKPIYQKTADNYEDSITNKKDPDSRFKLPDLPDSFYMPDPDDPKMYYSSLDLKSAHNSIVLTERASYYLNCILPNWKLIRFKQSPFGLKKINSTFNKVLYEILRDLQMRKLAIVYADDCILACRSKALHRRILMEVFRRFETEGIKLSINKCRLFCSKFQFLGFRLDEKGVSLTDERIRSINNIPTPHNLRSLQRLLGSLVYIAKFIPQLQCLLFPITELLKHKGPGLPWGQEQDEALNKIKGLVNQDMKLNFINTNRPLHMYVDSSAYGGGCALFQVDENGMKKPICFFSRKYHQDQVKSFSALELELCNLLDSLQRLKYYINLTSKPVVVHTDAKAICFLLRSQQSSQNPRLARLMNKLAGFELSFTLCYVKPNLSPELRIADFLSRMHEEDIKKPISMQALRKIKPEDIKCKLEPNKTYSMVQLANLVLANPDWVENFPTETSPNTSRSQCMDKQGYATKIMPVKPGGMEFDPWEILEKDTIQPETIHIHRAFFSFNDLSYSRLLKMQRSDPFLMETISRLVHHPPGFIDDRNFFIQKDLLYKKVKGDGPGKEISVITLPDDVVPKVVAYYHISLGHIGFDRLYSILKTLYYGKLLRQHTNDLAKGCHVCQVVKISNAPFPPYSPGPAPAGPGQAISMDFFKTPPVNGYNSILIIEDLFSGFIYLKPCRGDSSSNVITGLQTWFGFHGKCEYIKSDNGSSLLRNRQVKQFLSTAGISNLRLTLAYMPNHNPMVERSIRSVRHLMRSLEFGKPFNWLKNLSLIQDVYNTTPRIYKNNGETLLKSPLEIQTRRKMAPLNITTKFLTDQEIDQQYKEDLKETQRVERIIKEHLRLQKKRFMDEHNLKARKPTIHIGDLALIKDLVPPRPGEIAKKHKPAYKPELYIVRFVKDFLCVLENVETGATIYFSTHYVKKYEPRSEIFNLLTTEQQNIMGQAFKRLDMSTREKLLKLQAAMNAGEIGQGIEQTNSGNSGENNSNVSLDDQVDQEPLPPILKDFGEAEYPSLGNSSRAKPSEIGSRSTSSRKTTYDHSVSEPTNQKETDRSIQDNSKKKWRKEDQN